MRTRTRTHTQRLLQVNWLCGNLTWASCSDPSYSFPPQAWTLPFSLHLTLSLKTGYKQHLCCAYCPLFCYNPYAKSVSYLWDSTELCSMTHDQVQFSGTALHCVSVFLPGFCDALLKALNKSTLWLLTELDLHLWSSRPIWPKLLQQCSG